MRSRLRSRFIALLVSLLLIIAARPLPSTAIAPAQSLPTPRPAFESALARVDAQSRFGERYALGEVKQAGAWAFAIAEPIPGTAIGGMIVHGAVPMIGVFDQGAWQVIVPTPAMAGEFNALLANLPASLLDEADRAYFEQPLPRGQVGGASALNFSGYKLPWKKGLIGYAFSKDASGHVSQVDFDIQGLAASGDVLAAKPGTVVFVKESSNAGACGNFSNVWKQANMVVVQHGPAEFSWYVHLAYNSVPVNVGDAVALGAKIGVEGETGFACGVHVHFMVSSGHTAWTNPADPNAAPWASTNSLAPTDFVEVSWADIRVNFPNNTYVSQNDGQPICAAPAQQQPADGFVASAQTITFAWAAVADCSFAGYTLRVKNTADPVNGGEVIAETTTDQLQATLMISPTWNYQDLYWSVRANGAGTPWATRRLRLEPAITGVYTLYTGLDFSGNVFTSSQTISDVTIAGGGSGARSLKLDAGMGIVVCSQANFRGDCGRASGPVAFANLNTLAPNLAGNLMSIRACAGACPPSAITPTLASPIDSQVVLSGTAVTLRWQGSGDDYAVEVSGGTLTQTLSFGWQATTHKAIGVLAPSDQPYAWRVRAANPFGSSAWAQTQFVVKPAKSVFAPAVMRE
jgi:murein DD-endopeptidase MepM/ murein hydrolase activator NlpD